MRKLNKLGLVLAVSMILSMLAPLMTTYAAPSLAVVGTTTVTTAMDVGNQNRTFYSPTAGRYFVFWEDGTHLVYDSSPDGVTFSGVTTTIGDVRYHDATYFDFIIDAAGNIHYAITPDATHIHYRMGAPQNDGSITWAQAEQVAATVNNKTSLGIGIDSAGHVFIAYDLNDDSKTYVTRNDNTDGTWSTTAAFPYKVSDTVDYYKYALRAVGSNMLLLYSIAIGVVQAQLYTTGVGWGAEETATTSTSATWSASTMGTSVYLAFRQGGAGSQTRYVVRNGAGVWGAEQTISATLRYIQVTVDETSQVVFFFYRSADTGAGDLQYKKLIGGVLDTNPTVWLACPAALQVGALHSYPWVQSNTISVAWAENGAPKNINFAMLIRPTVTLQAETGITMDKDGVTGGTWNYTPTSIGDAATVDTWIKYGLSQVTEPYNYANTSAVNAVTTTDPTTRSMPTNATPGGTVYYRASIDGWGWSAQDTTVFTMPTAATAAGTISGANITLHGAVSNMGVASSTYVRFQWGYTSGANTYSTAWQTKTTATAFSQQIAADPSQRVYYRVQVRNGATTNSSSETSYYPATPIAQSQGIANLFPLIFLAAAIGMFAIAMTTESFTVGGLVLAVIFLIMSVTGVQTITAALRGLWGG